MKRNSSGSALLQKTEIQAFGTVESRPIALDQKVRATSATSLNQILADTMSLGDLL
jgi:hypothetical protein